MLLAHWPCIYALDRCEGISLTNPGSSGRRLCTAGGTHSVRSGEMIPQESWLSRRCRRAMPLARSCSTCLRQEETSAGDSQWS
jgi:hypothetical protein